MPSRVRNWDLALVRTVRPLLGQAFSWGTTDCGSLVRRAVGAMYGADVFAWLGAWDDEVSALRVLAQGGGMAGILATVGAAPVALAEAQSGDVLLAPVPEEPHEVFGLAGVLVSGKLCYVTLETGVRCDVVPADQLGDATVWRLPWALVSPEVPHG